MTAQFRNLVFEGGGVKGIAYVGAMQLMSQRGYLQNIDRVGGTSAGAINALIFALGYDIAEQRTILDSVDFRDFMDNSFFVLGNVRRLAKEYGWNKGDFFANWIGGLIQDRLGSPRATFADLQALSGVEFSVIGTNLSTGFAEVFSFERTPDMPLVTAVRISMSIPLYFTAMHHGERDDVYVDGGVILNYPVKLFDRLKYIAPDDQAKAARHVEYYRRENARFLLERPQSSPYVYNRQTLGLRLDTSEEIALYRYNEALQGKKIGSFSDYVRALMAALMRVQENQHLHGDDWQRTLYINTLDIGTTDFDLGDDQKTALIEEGIKGAETYFSWLEDPGEQPVNRLPAS